MTQIDFFIYLLHAIPHDFKPSAKDTALLLVFYQTTAVIGGQSCCSFSSIIDDLQTAQCIIAGFVILTLGTEYSIRLTENDREFYTK